MSDNTRTGQSNSSSSTHDYVVRSSGARGVLAVTRIALGFVFLWAFLDKLFGLGFSTPQERSWLNGGSPTGGYLKNLDPAKPLSNALASLASPVSDVLFMLAMLGMGLALILGIGLRVTAVVNVIIMATLWLAQFPLVTGEQAASNPLIDDHVVYPLIIIAFALLHAGDTLGLGKWWKGLVGKQKWLI